MTSLFPRGAIRPSSIASTPRQLAIIATHTQPTHRGTAVATPVDDNIQTSRRFSVLNRPPPLYPGHIPLTRLERVSLALGSGILSLRNPYRADLIAACGEALSVPYFIYRLRDAMLSHPVGRRILRDRPKITSTSLSLPHLRSLPPNSLGRTYVNWLDREHVSPDTRLPVRFIDDEECAYVMQRYRESHDFYHSLTGLPTVREGEVALKAFEFANTLLPMTGFACLSVFTMKKQERKRFWEIYGPWAVRNGVNAEEVINVYWEEEMATNVDVLRKRLGIETPPDMRDIRKRERDQRRKEKGEREKMGMGV
ncbi:Ubiquinone biosynthesis protein [Zalerion maritima]|uniref:4-hydroxy-3-methoxy-5-polyprenylbenzoate decarboxylase n=1 Tax=Zalerion maritima TaxID=339359 RepID=A0AAD5RSN5_9PEZI|nr:Ubiquinone biosynthesis protein [Zalerion maritima]